MLPRKDVVALDLCKTNFFFAICDENGKLCQDRNIYDQIWFKTKFGSSAPDKYKNSHDSSKNISNAKNWGGVATVGLYGHKNSTN